MTCVYVFFLLLKLMINSILLSFGQNIGSEQRLLWREFTYKILRPPRIYNWRLPTVELSFDSKLRLPNSLSISIAPFPITIKGIFYPTFLLNSNFEVNILDLLKEVWHEIFVFRFFHESVSSCPLSDILGPYRILMKIHV